MYLNSLKLLLEKEEYESEGLENDYYINEVDIKKIIVPNVCKFINSKIRGIEPSNPDEGYFSLSSLNSIFKIPFPTGKLGRCYISPAQLRGGQKKGTTGTDLGKYKKLQVLPFFVYKDDQTEKDADASLAVGSGQNNFELLFLIPFLGAEISEENQKEHAKIFGKSKNKHNEISYDFVKNIKIQGDEISKVFSSLGTGNPANVIATSKKSVSRRGSGASDRNANESFNYKDKTNKENIVDNYDIFNLYNNKNSYRNFTNMNDFYKKSLSSLLFEKEENLSLDVSGKANALIDLKKLNKAADMFNTSGKNITSIITAFSQKGLSPACDVKKIINNANSLQIIPFVKKEGSEILSVEKNGVKNIVVEFIPIPNIKLNPNNNEFLHSFFGIEGDVPGKDASYSFKDIDAFKTVFLPVENDDVESSIELLCRAILGGRAEVLLKLEKLSKQGTISANPKSADTIATTTESFVHNQGNMSSLLFEWRDEKSLLDEIKAFFLRNNRSLNEKNYIDLFEYIRKKNHYVGEDDLDVLMHDSLKKAIDHYKKSKYRESDKKLILNILNESIDVFENKQSDEDHQSHDTEVGAVQVVKTDSQNSDSSGLEDESAAELMTSSELPDDYRAWRESGDDEEAPESEGESGSGEVDGDASNEFADYKKSLEEFRESLTEMHDAVLNEAKSLSSSYEYRDFLRSESFNDFNNFYKDAKALYSKAKIKDSVKTASMLRDIMLDCTNMYREVNEALKERLLAIDKEENGLEDTSSQEARDATDDVEHASDVSEDDDWTPPPRLKRTEEEQREDEEIYDLWQSAHPDFEKADSGEESSTEEGGDVGDEATKKKPETSSSERKGDNSRIRNVPLPADYFNPKKSSSTQDTSGDVGGDVGGDEARAADDSLSEQLGEMFVKHPSEIIAVNTSDNKPFYVISHNRKIYQVAEREGNVSAKEFKSLTLLVKHITETSIAESFSIEGVDIFSDMYFKNGVLEYLNRLDPDDSFPEISKDSEDEGDEPESEEAKGEGGEPAGGDEPEEVMSASDESGVSYNIFYKQVESRLSKQYQRLSIPDFKIDPSEINKDLASVLKKAIDIKGTNESFVYKHGIRYILEEQGTPSKPKKINIEHAFKNLQSFFYEKIDFKANFFNSKKSYFTTKDLRAAIKKFGINISEKRFQDAVIGDGNQGYKWDFRLDYSKELAYAYCQLLIEKKDELKEEFDIVGTLQDLQEITVNPSTVLYSDRVYQKVRSNIENFDEVSFRKSLDEELKRVVEDICVNFSLKYDEDLKQVINEKIKKNREADQMSVDDYRNIKNEYRNSSFKSKAIGASVGAVVGMLSSMVSGPIGVIIGGAAGAKAGDFIEKKFRKEETFTSRRDEALKESTVKENVDKLNDFILSLAKDIKQVYGESKIIKGSLTHMLFEKSLLFEEDKKLTYDDIKKKLKSNQILVFGFPDIVDRNTAEANLTEAVCGLLEDLFDIKISGVSDAQNALALSRIGAALDEKAKAGEVASEEIAIATSDAGVPPNLNANMTALQLLQLLNQSGGDNLMQFMLLFMSKKDQMTELLEQMTNGRVSGQEAAQAINKVSGGKMSELESSLSEAIKTARIGLPNIYKGDAKKLILTLKSKVNQQKIIELIKRYKSDDRDDVTNTFNENIQDLIINNFNIKSSESYNNARQHKINVKNIVNLNLITSLDAWQALCLETLLLGIIFEEDIIERTGNEIVNHYLNFDNDDDKTRYVDSMLQDVNSVLKGLKIIVSESKARSGLFSGSLSNYLFEGSKRSSQSGKLSYNDPRYLELEMKRIWKI